MGAPGSGVPLAFFFYGLGVAGQGALSLLKNVVEKIQRGAVCRAGGQNLGAHRHPPRPAPSWSLHGQQGERSLCLPGAIRIQRESTEAASRAPTPGHRDPCERRIGGMRTSGFLCGNFNSEEEIHVRLEAK